MPDDIERRTPAARGGAPLVWALHDGRIGIENQVLGLAEALRLPFLARRFEPRFPWSWLPPALWPPLADAATAASDRLAAPWPDLLISCGRLCAAAAIAAKRASGGRIFIAQIQDPRLGRRHFDLMVVPRHDPARGANVFVTRGAVHRVTAERLAAAGRRFAPLLAHLPRPLVAVLIGGRNRVYRFDLERLAAIADQLAALARREGVGLLVTPSRRTGAEGERLLREKLAGAPAFIWDGSGDNPYLGFLELADWILVTEDSVSMATEAASTGKPVYILPLAGGSRKFRAFHRMMREAGATRPFAGALERWHYDPANDTAAAAAEIRRRLAAARLRAAQ
jgi:mitochondrial fission protein ELM1